MRTNPACRLNAALIFPGLLAVFILLGAGCGATKPGSASFASVTIRGAEPNDIQKATIEVFQADGYAAGTMEGQLVFQKEGSRMTTVAYEGLVGAHEGAQTMVRVKVQLVNLGAGTYRLQGQAYVVKGAGGDPFFQDEQRLANIRSGPYQNLLDKVAERFKSP
jgi:hypothetical protein